MFTSFEEIDNYIHINAEDMCRKKDIKNITFKVSPLVHREIHEKLFDKHCRVAKYGIIPTSFISNFTLNVFNPGNKEISCPFGLFKYKVE